jgi:WhiB family redox-sensing transcriptional regulator
MAYAACRDSPTETFFPTTGQNPDAARAICASCTVRDECQATAIGEPELVGVWGGTTEKERKALRPAEVRATRERVGPSRGRCGTYSGAQAHRKRGERPCEACRRARTEYTREMRKRKAAS